MPLHKELIQQIRILLERRIGISFQQDQLWVLENKIVSICQKHKVKPPDIEHALRHSPYSSFVKRIYEEVTTHHTYFFREPEILREFESTVLPNISKSQVTRFWSAATSTGEEAYTLAMLLHKNMYTPNNTRILGTDISEQNIAQAKLGIYDVSKKNMIPHDFHGNSFSTGKNTNHISRHIRSFCSFQNFNLIDSDWESLGTFNVVFMRNVLYYFSERHQKEVLEKAWERTLPGGWLITSISESLRYLNTSWQQVSACIYKKPVQTNQKSAKKALLFTDNLPPTTIAKIPPSKIKNLELHSNPNDLSKRVAIDFRSIITHESLLDTLEYKQFWKRVAIRDIPCFIYKENDTKFNNPFGITIAGEANKSTSLSDFFDKSIFPLQLIIPKRLTNKKPPNNNTSLIYGLGASTGGVSALLKIIPLFTEDTPPIVITIHMPKDFTLSFADQLNSITNLDVQEAQHGEKLTNGMIRIAPGSNGHLKVVQQKSTLITTITRANNEEGHVPSIDVLFESLAKLSIPVVATLMTGMGRDGAEGLWKIKRAGGYTLAQDEESSVIYGMPRVAWEQNAAYKRVDLLEIPASMKLGEEVARERFERTHEK